MKISAGHYHNFLKSFAEIKNLTIENAKSTFSAVINETLYSQILHDRSYYSALDKRSVKFIDPIINLQAFYNYVKDFNGFRFFPALLKSPSPDQPHNFFLMLSHADSEAEPNVDRDYFLLKNSNYPDLNPIDPSDPNDPNKPVDAIIAKPFLRDYHENILIDNKLQGTNYIFKKSRYYSLEDFNFYISNIDHLTYDQYTVHIEIGYITQIISNDYLYENFIEEFPYHTDPNRFPDPNSTADPAIYPNRLYHQGFTCLLRIYKGDIVMPFPTYPSDPSRLTLEIGHPCPPQCGSLSW